MKNPEQTEKASTRAMFAIFCATKYDVRGCNISREQASHILDLAKVDLQAALDKVASIPGAIKKGEAKPKQNWEDLYHRAHEAGLIAGTGHQPTPMNVVQHTNMADDNSPVAQRWHVPEGVCGFAWVVIKPGTSAFAKWLKARKLANNHYHGGVSVWVHEFNQSMERKEAYARAFAEVLTKAGITAYADSRMD